MLISRRAKILRASVGATKVVDSISPYRFITWYLFYLSPRFSNTTKTRAQTILWQTPHSTFRFRLDRDILRPMRKPVDRLLLLLASLWTRHNDIRNHQYVLQVLMPSERTYISHPLCRYNRLLDVIAVKDDYPYHHHPISPRLRQNQIMGRGALACTWNYMTEMNNDLANFNWRSSKPRSMSVAWSSCRPWILIISRQPNRVLYSALLDHPVGHVPMKESINDDSGNSELNIQASTSTSSISAASHTQANTHLSRRISMTRRRTPVCVPKEAE